MMISAPRFLEIAFLRDAVDDLDAVIDDSRRRRAELLERIRELTQPATHPIGAEDE